MQKHGTLHVEVKLLDHANCDVDLCDIEAQVQDFLLKTRRDVQVGSTLQPGPKLNSLVDHIQITGYNRSKVFPDTTTYLLADNDLDIAIYRLHTDNNYSAQAVPDQLSTASPLIVTDLPHHMFDGQWEALMHEEAVGELLLRTLTRAARKYFVCDQTLTSNAWYNTCLLHGPPGSGKTTLAQGLAQRLSIRLSDLYPRTKLLQIEASAIFSHMYGETAKQLASLFVTIRRLAADDGGVLVVVLIDEIDKLVPSRRNVGKKNEPLDTLRATAEVLTGLDKLRLCINIIWFFTTNLVEDLDPAFLDRCRLKEKINAPMADCVYDILRADINSKIQSNEIATDTMMYNQHATTNNHVASEDSPSDHVACGTVYPVTIPSLDWARKNWSPTSTTAASILRGIATLAAGLSGRNVRGLVDVAMFKHVVEDQPQLRDVLSALDVVVRKEIEGTAGKIMHEVGDVTTQPIAGSVEDDMDFLAVSEFDISTCVPVEMNCYSSDG